MDVHKLTQALRLLADALEATEEPLESTKDTSPPTPPPKAPEPQLRKGIQYDGVEDMPPPFQVDPVPERPALRGVAVKKGTVCVCSSCLKPIYVATEDVLYEKFSFSKFASVPGVPPIPEKLDFINLDGNVAVDCPICLRPKSVWLVGKNTSV